MVATKNGGPVDIHKVLLADPSNYGLIESESVIAYYINVN